MTFCTEYFLKISNFWIMTFSFRCLKFEAKFVILVPPEFWHWTVSSFTTVKKKETHPVDSRRWRCFSHENVSYNNNDVEEESISPELKWPLLLAVSLLGNKQWLLRSRCRPSLRFISRFKLYEPSFSRFYCKMLFLRSVFTDHAIMLTVSQEA